MADTPKSTFRRYKYTAEFVAGGSIGEFTNISGLELGYSTIPYRTGDDENLIPEQLYGRPITSPIEFSRGVLLNSTTEDPAYGLLLANLDQGDTEGASLGNVKITVLAPPTQSTTRTNISYVIKSPKVVHLRTADLDALDDGSVLLETMTLVHKGIERYDGTNLTVGIK